MKRNHTLCRCLTSDTPVTTAPTLGFVQDLSVLVTTNYVPLRDGFPRYLWSLHAGGPLALPTGCGPLLAIVDARPLCLDCAVSSEDRGLGELPLGVVAFAKLISISTFVEHSSLELPPRLPVHPEWLRRGLPLHLPLCIFARMGLPRKFSYNPLRFCCWLSIDPHNAYGHI